MADDRDDGTTAKSDAMRRDIDPGPEDVPPDVKGETVETEHGPVTPVQQNVGAGNTVGGGEFPDPSTTPSLFDPDADPTEEHDTRVEDDTPQTG